VATALDTLVRGRVLNGRAAHEETLGLAKSALRIKESRYGTESAELATSLLNLSDVLVAAIDFNQAIAAARRAVSLIERSAGTGSIDATAALCHLGATLANARRDDDAFKTLEQCLSMRERALAPTDTDIARTLEDLGFVLQRKGDYREAGAVLRRAQKIQEASSSKHPTFVRTLNLVAEQLWFEGHLLESKEVSEQAVELAERTLRSDHPTLALSLRSLGATLGDLGDQRRSLELKKRALAIAERNFGANHPVLAEYFHSLGMAELAHGDYSAARLHFQQALSIYAARYGESHELVATGYTVMALADARLGDYVNAGREQSLAVAIHSRVGGPNHPFVAIALHQLATVYLEQGSPARALPLLERALAIRENNLGPQHRDVARTLADLATALMQMGRPAAAQQLAARALHIWDKLDAPEAPEYARILSLYAKLQLARGDSAKARDYYERALAIRERVVGRSHPLYAEAQSGLALALAAAGDRSEALSTASAAEATGREHLSLMLRSLPEREALNYAAVRPRGLDLVLSLTASVPDAASMALDGLIRSRALVLDEIAARQGGEHSGDEGTNPRATLLSAQQHLANLIVRGPGQLSPAEYQALVDAARRESERAEHALAEASAEFRAARSRAEIGLEQVSIALPDSGALVSFTRYQRNVFGDSSSAPRTIPSYAAFVLRRDEPPAVIQLGSTRTIDTLVSRWRADISAEVLTDAKTPPVETRSSRQSGAALRRRIWDPLIPYLGGSERVFIVPEGALSLAPFAALPVGQRSYLLETGPIIHYFTAERDLVPPAEIQITGQGLLAVGGPSFDDTSMFRSRPKLLIRSNTSNVASPPGSNPQTCGTLQSARFQPLDGTLAEVQDLSAVWKGAAATEADAARLLVGRDATETRFKREAPGRRVLHLATHGFFLNGTCSAQPSGTRAIGGISTAEKTPRLENPLRLSGLALAGANRRELAGPNEDEGVLTAEEVASLNLDGVQWAVLSACDTGVGEIKAGEGVFGLRRAFQVAGARTVIMSLWSVDDEATRAWMRALYEARFGKKLSTADAVRAANLAVLRGRRAKGEGTHPFYWAAFVAVGDWR
jgi:CHAT domain-containing protein/tetratricopeptide (TPR) repeat protein